MDTPIPDPAIQLIDALGADAIKAATGVGDHAIRYARFSKKLPSRWYGPLALLCDELGISCPLNAFAWADPAAIRGGTEGSDLDHAVSGGDAKEFRKVPSADGAQLTRKKGAA